jgi:competence protein ComEC
MVPPLVYVAAAWVGGLLVAHHWLAPLGVEPAVLLCLCLLPLSAMPLWWEDRSVRLGGACALALLLGGLRYEVALPRADDARLIAFYNDGPELFVVGVVDRYPDRRDKTVNLVVDVDLVETGEAGGERRPASGLLLVKTTRFPEFQYGDRLRVYGRIETPAPFEDFDFRAYLARKEIYSLMDRPEIERLATGQGSAFWAAVYGLKDRARLALARMLPEPEASLLQGIVLGLKTGIPDPVYEEYNATGTSHIIVISGANISLVARLFALSFGQLLGKRRAYWLTLLGIGLYVLLVGADAAVIRAGLMGGLYVTALHLGRRATAYVSLAASAVLLTIITPLALWDPGFQLSFAATLSLILFSPPLERLLERGLPRLLSPDRAAGILRFLKEALVATLAAQVLTLPLVAYHFQRLSLVSPLANLLILPVQPPVMALGGLAALAGTLPLLEPLARVLVWLPWLCLAYTGAVVHTLAAWPLASFDLGHLGWQWPALYYTLLAAVAWVAHGGRGRPHPASPRAERALPRPGRAFVALALAAAILGGLALVQLPDGRLHVAFLDVGQGDAILITTPAGRQILVDGGPSPAALGASLAREMPFWDRSLDLLILTHADKDHMAGLAEVLARYRVGGWLDNGRASQEPLYVQSLATLEGAGIPRQAVAAGDRLEMDQGAVLTVLHPPRGDLPGALAEDNEGSLVLRLTWGEAAFLLTGDLGAAGEAHLLASGQPLDADVLKVAHHGSGSATGRDFLQAVAPRFAVISVALDNLFGHPDPALLERLGEVPDLAVLRTDEAGTVEFITDGERLWARTGR